MTRFAPFDPAAHGAPAADLRLRDATADDVDAIARIWHDRHGGDRRAAADGIARHLQAVATGDAPDAVRVAVLEGAVVAYGRCGFRDWQSDGAVDGWYLLGLVVDPAARRRGVGAALTRARMAWMRDQGADRAWYFVSDQNPASIAMHAAFGFRVVARTPAFSIPGVPFTGTGLLLAAPL